MTTNLAGSSRPALPSCQKWIVACRYLARDYIFPFYAKSEAYGGYEQTLTCPSILDRLWPSRPTCTPSAGRKLEGPFLHPDWCRCCRRSLWHRQILRSRPTTDDDTRVPEGDGRVSQGAYHTSRKKQGPARMVPFELFDRRRPANTTSLIRKTASNPSLVFPATRPTTLVTPTLCPHPTNSRARAKPSNRNRPQSPCLVRSLYRTRLAGTRSPCVECLSRRCSTREKLVGIGGTEGMYLMAKW